MGIRRILLIGLVLFANVDCFSQQLINAQHRRRHALFTLMCDADSMIVYIGKFKSYDFQSDGNCVRVNKKEIYTEGDTVNTLNFSNANSSSDSSDFLILRHNQILKIRVLPRECIRFGRTKKLLICLTINGENKEVYSRWYKHRFKFLARLINHRSLPDFVILKQED